MKEWKFTAEGEQTAPVPLPVPPLALNLADGDAERWLHPCLPCRGAQTQSHPDCPSGSAETPCDVLHTAPPSSPQSWAGAALSRAEKRWCMESQGAAARGAGTERGERGGTGSSCRQEGGKKEEQEPFLWSHTSAPRWINAEQTFCPWRLGSVPLLSLVPSQEVLELAALALTSR